MYFIFYIVQSLPWKVQYCHADAVALLEYLNRVVILPCLVPHVSLSMKMCVQRKAGTPVARLYLAKNEAPEAESCPFAGHARAERKGQVFVDERAITVQLRWVWKASEQEAGAHFTCRLADNIWSVLVNYSRIYSASRGDGPFFDRQQNENRIARTGLWIESDSG